MKMKILGLIGLSILMLATTACSMDNTNEGNVNVAGGEDELLTLFVAEPSDFIEIVKNRFEKKHPHIKLDIQSFRTGEEWGPGEFEKYQKTLNTALLSGNGPDLVEVGMLPIEEYVDKGMFMNMAEALNRSTDLDKDDLHMNVMTGMGAGGDLYTVPVSFYLSAFIGDHDVLRSLDVNDDTWSWKEFREASQTFQQKAAQQGEKSRYALANLPPNRVLYEMVRDNYAAFVDQEAKTAKFNSSDFQEMMQDIKQMFEEGIMTAEVPEDGESTYYADFLISVEDVIHTPFSYFEQPSLLQRPHADGQTGAMKISPGFQFAIRDSSPLKEEAWAFVSFLLSEEVQELEERDGFSLLKSVNEQKLSDIQQQLENGTFLLSDGSKPSVEKAYFTRFQELLEKADYYGPMEVTVLRIVEEESQAFFNGQKTAQAVAELIQNRATTYLNE
ncbi:ABC transporter substrate-binding protein [Paenibacillus daejeonensis]|uniref:ABC transporter substrate-binding protein n=1 Tax=Paenibacillus daejeonensis TaxID=135193 RepID=UPI000363C2A1|nr:ABC transporter substrate-binding protein [Paenibacillus daejeonensis]